MYKVVYAKHAVKDSLKIKSLELKEKVEQLLVIIEKNPWQNPPPFGKLIGDLQGCYSRRINLQHRLVYQVYEDEQVIKILRMWSHYGDN